MIGSSRARRRDSLALGIWVAIVIASGVAWGLCFGREERPLLGWVALVPLVLLGGAGGVPYAIWGREVPGPSPARAFALGWLHGVVSWTVSIPWIIDTVGTYGGLPRWLAVLALLALAVYLGLYHAIFAGLGSAMARTANLPQMANVGGGAWTAWLILPCLWVALEWVRGWALSGFPWNLAAYSWAEMPGALPLAAWIGAFGVSWLVVAANVAVARALARRSAGALLAGGASIAAALVLGWWVPPPVLSTPDPGAKVVKPKIVRIVQPNTGIFTRADDPRVVEGYRRLFALSECGEASLVVWPESAAWPYDLERDQGYRSDVLALLEEGCELLLNGTTRVGDRYFNSALLASAQGVQARYDKTQLVPFGEYVPLGGALPFLRQIARLAGEFSAGVERNLLPWGDERLGVAICFEIIFPRQVAERVERGATILVTLTNDAWYGDTSAPVQHLRAARFRAAENRRPVLRAAITGISAVIDPYGRVLERIAVGRQGVIERPVVGQRTRTLASRWPSLVPVGCAFASVVWLIGLGWAARRARP